MGACLILLYIFLSFGALLVINVPLANRAWGYKANFSNKLYNLPLILLHIVIMIISSVGWIYLTQEIVEPFLRINF